MLNSSLSYKVIPIEYESDLPASARDLPDVANSFFARSDPGANLILSKNNNNKNNNTTFMYIKGLNLTYFLEVFLKQQFHV